MRLRDFPSARLSWRDLLVIVQCAPPDSPLARVMEPEVAAQLDTQLLRSIEYSVRWLAWSKTRDGHNGRRPPEHVRFPWEEPQRKPGIQGDAMGLDEAVEWLGWSEHLAVENARREAAGLPTIKGEVTRG